MPAGLGAEPKDGSLRRRTVRMPVDPRQKLVVSYRALPRNSTHSAGHRSL